MGGDSLLNPVIWLCLQLSHQTECQQRVKDAIRHVAVESIWRKQSMRQVISKEPLSNPSIVKVQTGPATHVPRIACDLTGTRQARGVQTHYGLCHCQTLAVQIQVHQRETGAQPMMVLLNSTVSHLLEAKDALQYPERMFHLRPYSRLHPVLRLF